MEGFEAVGLLAHADELDRLAGDLAHRQGGAAARIAVQLGEDHAGQRQRIAECLGGIDRILPGHRIDHEQGFNRFERGVQLLNFRHHRGIDSQAPGGIDDQHVVIMLARKIQRGQRDILRFLADVRGKEVNFQLLRQRAQLLDRRRAIHVATDQQHFFLVLVAQQFGEFAAGGGLARTLQTSHQDHGRRGDGEIERIVVLAHQPGEFAMHHANHGLPRVQVADDLLPERGLLDLSDEFLDDRQRDVGFEQRHAYFAQRILDVAFGQARLPAQGFDHAGEAIGKVI